MRQTPLLIIGGAFVLLMIGLIVEATGGNFFPLVNQVSNPEASTTTMTGNQGAMLIILAAVVLGGIVFFSIGLGGAVWFLNRQVVAVQEQSSQPVELLSGGANLTSTRNALLQNSMLLMVGLGIAAVFIVLVLLLL